MIITENITINGKEFVRTTSDAGRYIVRDGFAYGEAVDPVEYASERVYTEGEVMPEEDNDGDTATIADYQAALSEMGVRLYA